MVKIKKGSVYENTEKLTIDKYFTKEGKSPSINYVKTDIAISDEAGKQLFVQKDSEFPNFFSELSKKIVSSRYFYGEPNTSERETSFKTLVDRVTQTYNKWAVKNNYFSPEDAKTFQEELATLNLTQKMAFNSPVWFNVGTDKYESAKSDKVKDFYVIDHTGKAVRVPKGKAHLYPQTSACFIQGVEDTMEDIMNLATREASLFKYGSGTGTDLSTLRSSREKLSGGGIPSGPLAYWVFYDKVAGIVKSGGKTRRAAKMNSLRADHPDIMEFIKAKSTEEDKIDVLINNGFNKNYGMEAVESVHFQNTNVSVRLLDDFMKAYENGGDWQTIPVHSKEMINEMPKYKAKEILEEIAKGTWRCGDPGVQFHDTINKWHTCKVSGEIKASNPCSEYMFINFSSCNLASLNLRGFMNEDKTFNTEDFGKAIEITANAMDLNYNNSSFPVKEIAQNSYDYRPLGLGYANLGSLIMSLGLPYDSEEARATAASITALMTGKTYEASIEMSKKLGPFKEYEKNKESMLEVMAMHKEALDQIDRTKLPEGWDNVLDEAYRSWENVLENGKKYGFRNAQATVLAPTGTIGFMMDCDTKGVEPEIGLVQTKLLAEGGTLRMVNGTVPLALTNLGYNQEEIMQVCEYIAGKNTPEGAPGLKKGDYETAKKSFDLFEDLGKLGYKENEILDIKYYIRGHETAEGCEILKPEHVAVFDCSNKPSGTERAIDYMGHINMMAAVQPFLSGAISKTVNMSEEATPEEIEKVYYEAWKKGLKAVAIYRDGSKNRQPMSFSKKNGKGLEAKVNGDGNPIRKKLPNTRSSITHKFEIAGHGGYLTVGLYDNGQPGEIFINMSKEGSTLGGIMDTWATTMSMGLQYGVPLEKLIEKYKSQKFEPNGMAFKNDAGINFTTSIPDYIAKWLEFTFVKKNENEEEATTQKKTSAENIIKKITQKKTTGDELGAMCPACGNQMVKKGHCSQVCNCGFVDQTGCGG